MIRAPHLFEGAGGRRGLEPRTSALADVERCAYERGEVGLESAAAGVMWSPRFHTGAADWHFSARDSSIEVDANG